MRRRDSLRRSVPAAVTAAVLAVTVAVASASAATAREGHHGTTGPDPYVIIATTLTDSKVSLSKNVTHGVHYVAFLVKNTGKKPHNFVIGTIHTRLLKPGQTQHVVSFFPDYGTFGYACTANCSAAMRGKIKISR